MSAADLPLPSHGRLWLPSVWAMWIVLALALLRGLISLAAVLNAGDQCRSDDVLLAADGGTYLMAEPGVYLSTGNKIRRCQLVVSNFKVPLPAWAVKD